MLSLIKSKVATKDGGGGGDKGAGQQQQTQIIGGGGVIGIRAGNSSSSSSNRRRNSGADGVEVMYSYEPSVGVATSSNLRTASALDFPPPPPLLDPTPPALPARNAEVDRPPSRSDRPSSRNSNGGSRSRQPRMGMSVNSQNMFESNELGLEMEAAPSSTRVRNKSQGGRGGKASNKGEKRGGATRPRTAPNQVPRGYSLQKSQRHNNYYGYQQYYPSSVGGDDDSGIMSEAETSSTTRSSSSSSKRHHHRSRGSSGPLRQMMMATAASGGDYGKLASSSTLFEEDPGVMSEAETASTSSRSRTKSNQKSALPVVRTPSKTLERSLGIVYLIYRGEAKRALLPNEVTSDITVKALFVRSFGKVLTLDYLELPRVKIYVLDAQRDVFDELRDLGDVRDGAVLKVFEPDASGKGPGGLGPSGLPPITNTDELLECEFETTGDKSRTARAQPSGLPGYRSLPRNAFSNADPSAGMVPPEGILKLPNSNNGKLPRGHRNGNRVESGYISSPDGHFEFDQGHGHPSLPSRIPHASRFSSTAAQHHQEASRYYPGPSSTEEAKARMMHMEAQLSQLTGLVEKALKNKRLGGGKKQVSFDKSVTFSDEQPPSILTTSKRHQSQKQAAEEVEKLLKQHARGVLPAAELHRELRRLHRGARELKQEVRVLRRLTQLQSMAMKDLVQDTYLKLREACVAFSTRNGLASSAENLEHWRIAQDEETFSRELSELLTSITELEVKVEEVRSGVINKKDKIPIQDVESMALALSQCSKTVTQLRQAFPTLEANLKLSSTSSGDSLMAEFLRRSSDKLDGAWRRCKKLTGTLVTLKRLASVQEQRFHPTSAAAANAAASVVSLSPTPANEASRSTSKAKEKESTLDDLLNALQNYTTTNAVASNSSSTSTKTKTNEEPQQQPKKEANPTPVATVSPMKKPAAASAKPPPPCPPPRTTTAPTTTAPTTKGAPPPPPPRTSSTQKVEEATTVKPAPPAVAPKPDVGADVMLEIRHQELLSRQKMLQEQYQRLQEMQKKSKAGNSSSYTAVAEDTVAVENGNGVIPSSSESSAELKQEVNAMALQE